MVSYVKNVIKRHIRVSILDGDVSLPMVSVIRAEEQKRRSFRIGIPVTALKAEVTDTGKLHTAYI